MNLFLLSHLLDNNQTHNLQHSHRTNQCNLMLHNLLLLLLKLFLSPQYQFRLRLALNNHVLLLRINRSLHSHFRNKQYLLKKLLVNQLPFLQLLLQLHPRLLQQPQQRPLLAIWLFPSSVPVNLASVCPRMSLNNLSRALTRV